MRMGINGGKDINGSGKIKLLAAALRNRPGGTALATLRCGYYTHIPGFPGRVKKES